MANLVDSNKTMLPVGEIIRIAAENTESPVPANAIEHGIKVEMKQPGALPMRYGNTIFLCHKTKERMGMFRALNADMARNFVQNGNRWVVQAYNAGFDFMVTQFDDPTLINIFKAISRKPPRPKMAYQVLKLRNGKYQVVLQLGPKREGEQK